MGHLASLQTLQCTLSTCISLQSAYWNTLAWYFIESVPMVTELIDQVLALHPGVKWFHIGGDEARLVLLLIK